MRGGSSGGVGRGVRDDGHHRPVWITWVWRTTRGGSSGGGGGAGVRDDGHHRPVWITRGGARRGVDLVVGLGGV